MNRSIHFSFATLVSIATIAGYISLSSNIAKSQQATTKTCDRATKEGYPFPSTTGYIQGYQVKAKTGLSTVTVDNSQGDFDVFIKLFTLSSERPQTVRAFLIQRGQKFTAENITRGTYDVRYRNLSTCRLFRTDEFKLKEIPGKIASTTLEMTIYPVRNGNTKHRPIRDDEF